MSTLLSLAAFPRPTGNHTSILSAFANLGMAVQLHGAERRALL